MYRSWGVGTKKIANYGKKSKHSKKDKKKNGKKDKDKQNQRKEKVNENNCGKKSAKNDDVAMSGDKSGVVVGQVAGTHDEPPSKKRRVSNDVATS